MARCKHNIRYGDGCWDCSAEELTEMLNHKYNDIQIISHSTQNNKEDILDLSMKIASELVKKEFPNERDTFKYHMYVFRQGAQQAAFEILSNPEKYLHKGSHE